MNINDLIPVKVTKVEDGFVLVNYNGQEATLQQTELTWNAGRVIPQEHVMEGQEIIVRVIAVEGKKFRPSLKQVKENRWNTPPELGKEYYSPVSMVTEFGYFVKVEYFCNALLLKENSKCSHSENDLIRVKIISVDADRNRVMIQEI